MIPDKVFFIILDGDLNDEISEIGLLTFVAVFGVVMRVVFFTKGEPGCMRGRSFSMLLTALI